MGFEIVDVFLFCRSRFMVESPVGLTDGMIGEIVWFTFLLAAITVNNFILTLTRFGYSLIVLKSLHLSSSL